MYLQHFQLAVKPFQITSDPRFLWLGEKHKEALATLRYGISDNRGFLLLTGEVGTGKTLLINRLMTMLEQDTIVATLPDPDLVSMDFYNLVADGFKMNRTFDSKGAFLLHLRDFLHQSHTNNKQVLLIIDECQRLKHSLMEDIRVLSNIELHDRKLINIFFVGQQEFNAFLSAPENRALSQRITVRYHIAPLEKEEIATYIFHRLRVAGGTRKIFTTSAIEQIFTLSGGIPRLINILCDHALLTAYAREAVQVDEHVITECAEELGITLQSPGNNAVVPARAPESKSISEAVKTAQISKPSSTQGFRVNAAAGSTNRYKPKGVPRFFYRLLLYAGIVLVLMFLAGFFITRFSSEEKVLRLLLPERYGMTLPPDEPAVERGENKNTAPMSSPLLADNGPTGANTDHDAHEPVTDGVTEIKPEGPTAPSPAWGGIEPLPLIKEKIIIRFTLNSNDIDSHSYEVLDRIAQYLIEHPDEHIKVRGFTDSSGSQGYNESVSRFRVSTVKSYLLGRGAAAGQIHSLPMGDHSPIAPNDTVEGRIQNRRVEIEFDRGR